jgi:hypothetical protein
LHGEIPHSDPRLADATRLTTSISGYVNLTFLF